MIPIHYRYLREVIALPNPANKVTLEARKQSVWLDTKADQKTFQDLLIVRGELMDKANRYPVEWAFDLTVPIWQGFRHTLSYFQNSGDFAAKTAAIELEKFSDVEWLRIGVIRRQDGNSGYLEFRKDGDMIRAEYPQINDLYQVRSLLAPLFEM